MPLIRENPYNSLMGAYDQIMTLIPALSDDELLRLSRYLTVLKPVQGRGDAEPVIEQEIYQALSVVALDRGLAMVSWPVFRKTRSYPILKKACVTIGPFAKQLAACQQVDRQAIYRLAFAELAKDLERREIPVSPLTLVTSTIHLPYHFEKSFPGYINGGLLPTLTKILRQV